MNPEKIPDTNLETSNQSPETSSLEKEKNVEQYILGTLLYTPQFYVKNNKYVEIKAYAPGEQQPSMKIFRMIFRLSQGPNDPEDVKEIAFQDEVDIIKDGKRDTNERWQVNFSVYIDKESLQYKSINERPKSVEGASSSAKVFGELAKQKGSILHSGDWRFESDGNSWVPIGRDGNRIDQSELKTITSSQDLIE